MKRARLRSFCLVVLLALVGTAAIPSFHADLGPWDSWRGRDLAVRFVQATLSRDSAALVRIVSSHSPHNAFCGLEHFGRRLWSPAEPPRVTYRGRIYGEDEFFVHSRYSESNSAYSERDSARLGVMVMMRPRGFLRPIIVGFRPEPYTPTAEFIACLRPRTA